MNEATIENIVTELRDALVGRKFGKIFDFGRSSLAVDFRCDNGAYLYISVEPASARLHLIQRTMKELNEQSQNPSNFALVLRKRLSHAVLKQIRKFSGDRILEFTFEARDESGLDLEYFLIAQMTGRSSNVFLLDSSRTIVDSIRETFGEGQQTAEIYSAPPRSENQTNDKQDSFSLGESKTLSEALDKHFSRLEILGALQNRAGSARAKIRGELKKKKKLHRALEGDLKNHGDPEKWKRTGDLLNANISTAKRSGEKVILVDYFDETLPEIEFELDDNQSVAEAAEENFKKYSKSKTAKLEIGRRLKTVEAEIAGIQARAEALEKAIEEEDTVALDRLLPVKKTKTRVRTSPKENAVSKCAREYTSSDGLPILVGKRSKDNDYLTFRVARSLDIWMHAADYPGSHVVIRRAGKQDIPQRTIHEAACLAAFYSKAKNEGKAAVRYTERKFVNKPKGAAPGLVSLASSKTIIVKPGIPDFEI